MRRYLALAVLLALAVSGGLASAEGVRSWDDLDWWGQSNADPDVVKDSSRSGYWWWPTDPASNDDDSELWGNRGVVFAMYTPPPPPPPPVVEAPPGPTPEPSRVVPVLNHVLFDFDKSVLKAEGKAVIDNLVNILNEYGDDVVVIEGHTCDIGSDQYNLGLGQRRADAVEKYMLDSGVPQNRLSAKSFGESQPAVSNDTSENRTLNRRVVFKYRIGD